MLTLCRSRREKTTENTNEKEEKKRSDRSVNDVMFLFHIV